MMLSTTYDAERQRLIVLYSVLEGRTPDDVLTFGLRTYALTLTRGAERWVELTIERGPGSRWGAALLVDPGADRLLLLGGEPYPSGEGIPLEGPRSLWQLNLAEGAERWSIVESAGEGVQWFGASWLRRTPDDPYAYYVGGRETDGTGGDRMMRVSLISGHEAFEILAQTLPHPRVGSAAVVDAQGRGLLIGGYSSDASSDAPSGGVLAFDFATATWRELETSGAERVPPSMGGLAVRDARTDRLWVVGSRSYLDVAILDADRRWEPFDLHNDDFPLQIVYAAHVPGNGHLTVVPDHQGVDPDDVLGAPRAWRFDYRRDAWSPLQIAADPRDGAPVGQPEWIQNGNVSAGHLLFREAWNSPFEVWRLNEDRDSVWWTHLQFVEGERPSARGPMTTTHSCGLVMYSNDRIWKVEACDGRDSGCRWTSVASPGTGYGGNSASAVVDSTWVMYGPDDRVAVTHACGREAFSTPTVTGTAPHERWLHTMTAIDDDRILVHAGGGPSNSDTYVLTRTDDTSWTWQPLPIHIGDGLFAPRARRSHAAGWDRVRQRLVVVGGSARTDAWELLLR